MTIRPDWEKIAVEIGEDSSVEHLNAAWNVECKKWLTSISNNFGGGLRIYESDNFSILSRETDRYLEVFSSFLEGALKRILNTLAGVAVDEGYGKHVAIIFENIDHYYEYVSNFELSNDSPPSSGMFINEGYGHFVFPSQDMSFCELIAVHELTHSCLQHLPIPLWVNEGLAVFMEEVLAGNSIILDQEWFDKHQSYWNEETIQNFWCGRSFRSTDEECPLSYHLAHVLTRNMSSDPDAFLNFVNAANFEDAGAKAAEQHLGFSLEYLVGSFLGPGNWLPKSQTISPV